jgi:hypothetical protein
MALRDLGKGILDLARPDGGTAINSALSTLIPKGVVSRITDLSPSKATDALKNGVSKVLPNPNKPLNTTKNLPNVILNPLENFASYIPIWTLACLTPEQFNNPPSYRNNPADLKHIVMSSGGRFDAQRVQTASGTPEFYINNFIMKAVVGGNTKTGNSNAFKFEWDIYEPYSMGLLLQSLQIAAKNAGYVNYLNNTPYVLRLDFVGYDELGKPYTTIKPKFFTLALVNAKFQVNEQGSTYKMEAIPFNQKGFSDTVNVAYNDVKLAAGAKGTVEEVLAGDGESLVKVLNDIEKRLVDDKQIKVPDQYSIVFPTTSSDFTPNSDIPKVEKATVDPNATPKQVVKGTNTEVKVDFDTNDIGGASLGFNQGKGGTFVMKKNDTRDEKTGLINRDKMTIDPKKRVFQFAQGQSLTAIINQIVLSSDYAKKAIDPKYKTTDGFIKWFRLDVQIELLKYDDWVGDYARKFTYRVVPFFVHESIFTNPNSTPIGYQEIQKKICKGYNYIYTGENVDVLKFDISINNLFFTGVDPSKQSDTAQSSDPNTSGGSAPQTNKDTKTEKGSSPAAQLASGGRARLKRDPDLLDEKPKGGANQKDTEQQVAEAFHAAFTKSNTELVTVNLEILGDPYWVVDSGFANYFAKASAANPALTEDGTMNYESGDVYIYLTFKTPVDLNEATGLYDYPNSGKESPFSGIYRVTACESQFNEGQFKQKLTCIRMPGQAIDYANNPPELNASQQVNKATSMATTVGKAEKDKTSPTDDPPVSGGEGE